MAMTPDHTKAVLDITSIFAAFGAFFEYLPTAAALCSLIWTSLRIVEMFTGKSINELLKGKQNG
jgi:hypothetical protein